MYQNFEPYEPLGQTNVDGYLKHHYHVVVLTAAEKLEEEPWRRADEISVQFWIVIGPTQRIV